MDIQVRQTLDRITNMLFAGGVNNPITYIEQLSYLIYLKMLDEEEARRAGLQARLLGEEANGNAQPLFPEQAERYRWSNWRFKSGEDLVKFVRDEVFPYMASLVKEAPRVAVYFQDARLEVDDPAVLKQVVDEIDTIQFSKMGPDAKGDIFEYLLTYLSTMEGALLGQFRTPKQIRAMMVEMVDPDLGDTIFDPACGTGGFLIDAVEHVLARYSSPELVKEAPIYGETWLENKGWTLEEAKRHIPNLQTYKRGPADRIPTGGWETLERSVYGFDVSRQMMRIAMMNMVLHGLRNANIKRANTLSETSGLTDEDLKRRYRVILSNPPFAGVLPKDSIRKDLPTKSKKSELLFLGVMMHALAPGGRCAVVLPEGVLFGSTSAHRDLRRKLVHEFELLAVVSLPAGVFKPYAGVKTSVLVFRKPKAERVHATEPATQKVWFYEVRNDGYDPDKVSGGGRVETPEANDIPALLAAWKAYKASGFREPPGVEANAVLEPGTEPPACWWAKVERIAENDYNLSAGLYKPLVRKERRQEDPGELIEELLDLEHRIAAGLMDLLREVDPERAAQRNAPKMEEEMK